MNTKILPIVYFLLCAISCSTERKKEAILNSAKFEMDAQHISKIRIIQFPESPEEGITYSASGAHPYEIQVDLTNGTEFYHYFNADGKLRKSEKNEAGKITTITDLR